MNGKGKERKREGYERDMRGIWGEPKILCECDEWGVNEENECSQDINRKAKVWLNFYGLSSEERLR